MAEELLDRNLYRQIKRMDRKQMEAVMQDFYNMGKQSVSDSVFNMNELKSRIGKVKGIGENRLNEIMDVIEGYIDDFGTDKEL